jgi:type IV pilus assembly protein PilY1
MKIAHTRHSVAKTLLIFLAASQFAQTVQAASTDLANVPMAVSNSVTPNVLVVLDNSESMDGYMTGTLVSGNDPNTRGNVGRSAMRNLAITPYRMAFNWGLMSFAIGTPTLYSTYVYLMGNATDMVFTNDCTGYVPGVFNGAPFTAGVSGDGGGRCVANPQPLSSGLGNYITFRYSSDDYNISDVLYYGAYAGSPAHAQAFAPSTNTSNPTSYNWYLNHSTSVNTWNNPSDFSSSWLTGSLSATDAGFLPVNNASAPPPNDISRSLYLPRGWGYYAGITGAGKLNEAVMADSTTHYNNLMALLGNETNGATGEIKNAAVYTPTAGTLSTARSYFSGSSTPIKYACQQNFVMLVTDGLPTATTSGSMYSAADRNNTCTWDTTTNTCTTGTLSTAVNDVITQLSGLNGLRTTSVSGITSTKPDGSGSVTGKFDIQTYIVGLGNTVVNANNFSALNAMAYKGGGMNQALLATDTATFNAAISAITSDITAKTGAAAAVAVANAQVTSTNDASYASSYNSGTWTGDLNAYPINLTTGLPGTTSLWAAGSAQAQLDTKTSASRYIVTSTDVAGAVGGVQFQPTTAATTTKLSASQQTLLNTPTLIDGAAVLAYLRGDRSGEPATYRARSHLLGDIVDAEPVVVNGPSAGYMDKGYQGSTTTFKEVNANRTNMVYQSSNDGMLHAFNALTGAEAWAYVPNLVMSTLNNLSSKSVFSHQYRVDGTPASGDVDFNNINCLQPCTNTTTNWHTILVGGLGKGGRGYYALDVTNPDAANEAAVVGKVLWEFPNSVTNATARGLALSNTGYSFGKPVIVKTKATGWVVLVTSGYNNGTNVGDSGGDGLGHLFVLNPNTGDLLKDIPTTGCTATPTSNPCGLAQISAYVENGNTDNTTDFVYGGDLKGNVWRFDLSGSTIASWSAVSMAVLKDSGGTTQPITTPPDLGKTISTGGTYYRYVYVGTGEYLGNSDVSTTQIQTMYGLVDPQTRATTDALYGLSLPTLLRNSLVAQTLTASGTTRTASSNVVDPSVKNGWYIDLNLPPAGERINTAPVLANGVLTFTTNIPSAVVCVPGGSSWIYFLDFNTGGAYTNPATGVTAAAATSLGNALASRVVLIQLPSGKVVALVRMSGDPTGGNAGPTNQAINSPASPPVTAGKRVSWRELVQ